MHSLNYFLCRLLAQLDATARTCTALDVLRGILVHGNSLTKSTELDCHNLTEVKTSRQIKGSIWISSSQYLVLWDRPTFLLCKWVTPHPAVFESLFTSK